MALLWRREKEGRLFEVRTAGRTRRLYVDGVLHSQYNPRTVVTGSVWDLLMLPALLSPEDTLHRVLILGLGGGALVHLLRRFVGPRQMVAVEIDPVVLDVARRFFAVAGPDLNLCRADAVQWTDTYAGQRFDLVVDDAFAEIDGEPVRGIDVNGAWAQRLCRLVSPEGTLVVNFPDRGELEHCALVAQARFRRRFKSAVALSTPFCDNAVGAFFRAPCNVGRLRACVERSEMFRGVHNNVRFRMGKLW